MLPDAPPPYGTLVFDCDSTLSAMEGIEELSGGRPEIAVLTRAAMEGEIPLEQVYGRRLELVRPTRADVARIGALYVERALPNAARLVAALQELEKEVWIVSGGLAPAVEALGLALGVPLERVLSVRVHFDARGEYAGFDERSPLARSGGKIAVLADLAAHAPGPLAFVGDGATDLEAAHLVQRFVAFGGVERRASVLRAARVACLEPDFRALVPLLLSSAEIATLAGSDRHRSLVAVPSPGESPPTA
jgi:phosphoserine phosphatase